MNALANESSPYLLQHRNNPVEWFAWHASIWEKAKAENKLVLISIGYSACHWCHVMEKEVFEDHESAEFMNQHFICVKVDREERPDVDSIYMDAVHLMGGRGGWPLNVFVLPDGRPVYGGTYFPKQQWLNILENLAELWRNEPGRMLDYAGKMKEGMHSLTLVENMDESSPFTTDFLDLQVSNWSRHWDKEKGGSRGAPKFPMPNNLEFLLQYGVLTKDQDALNHVHTTLSKMALGGIFDQAGGGFCRYSVDDIWKVPHFEKMLYDNAQLISLYSKAYRQSKNPLFLRTALHVVDWLQREMKADNGLYYSALDADSEGVEGKFYTWSQEELRTVLKDDFEFAVNYYALGKEGFWEHDQNILLRNSTDEEYALKNQLSLESVQLQRNAVDEKLMEIRAHRIRPGLDDKCITSWNALLISAFVEIYRASGDEKFLREAEQLMISIKTNLFTNAGELYHCITKGRASISAFLDAYASLADAGLRLYEANFDAVHLQFAEQLSTKAAALFRDKKSGLFYFTPMNGEEMIVRKMEMQDNVIPSSNSMMAKVLFELSRHFENATYEEWSIQMLRNVLPKISHASAFTNWLQLYAWLSMPSHEVVVSGKNAGRMMQEIQSGYHPSCIFAASTTESELPLFRSRYGTQTDIYVCKGKSCFPPTDNIQNALALLH